MSPGGPTLLSRLSWEVLGAIFLCCTEAHQLADWCWMKQTLVRLFFGYDGHETTSPCFSASCVSMKSAFRSAFFLPPFLPSFPLCSVSIGIPFHSCCHVGREGSLGMLLPPLTPHLSVICSLGVFVCLFSACVLCPGSFFTCSYFPYRCLKLLEQVSQAVRTLFWLLRLIQTNTSRPIVRTTLLAAMLGHTFTSASREEFLTNSPQRWQQPVHYVLGKCKILGSTCP